MQFSETTNNSGILQSCESWVFGDNYGAITDNTERKQTFTRLCNRALDKIAAKIRNSDTRWQWDDTNYTDYPIGTTDLVDGQQDYPLSVSHEVIERVEIKGSDGNEQLLIPIDQEDIDDQALAEFYKNDGVPKYYDKKANSVFLYPAPDANEVTTTDGLKVHFQRDPDYFDTSDTTKEPGFMGIYHELVPMWASYYYCRQNQMHDKANAIRQEITLTEQDLQNSYNQRGKDDRPKMTSIYSDISYK